MASSLVMPSKLVMKEQGRAAKCPRFGPRFSKQACSFKDTKGDQATNQTRKMELDGTGTGPDLGRAVVHQAGVSPYLERIGFKELTGLCLDPVLVSYSHVRRMRLVSKRPVGAGYVRFTLRTIRGSNNDNLRITLATRRIKILGQVARRVLSRANITASNRATIA